MTGTKAPIEAIHDLEEVRKAVFGDVGDEPNVYADYDRCSELSGKMRRAIATLNGPSVNGDMTVEHENVLEDAAKAAFTKAQSVYRADHDHFPIKHTWETTLEGVREGWRSIAYAAVEAAVMPPLGTQPEPRRLRSALVPPAVPGEVTTPVLSPRPSYCKPRRFLLLASYCGDDTDGCTDTRPCAECLAMCNIYGEDGKYISELGALPASPEQGEEG